ncbi:MAG: 30S ribosomal protein S24e [Methanomicrobiaceae archaeon]|nr:30S ribosomal protein S24e [Methanomicrobiaceae archaeon]
MEFEFIRDERNELLARRELEFVLTFEGPTPSRQEILGKLCALKNIGEQVIVLDSLKTTFGKQEILGTARVYDDAETLNKTEREYLAKRGRAKAEEEGA